MTLMSILNFRNIWDTQRYFIMAGKMMYNKDKQDEKIVCGIYDFTIGSRIDAIMLISK